MAAGSTLRALTYAGRALRIGLAAVATACSSRAGLDAAKGDGGVGAATPTAPDPIAELRPFEAATRSAFDFVSPPSAETGLGPDPWAVRRVGTGWVGILRGRSAVVLLDDDLREVDRLPAPRSPTGLAVTKSGEVLVVGELSASIARFVIRGQTLAPLGESRVPGVLGLRDVAVSPAGAVWVADERGARVLRVTTASAVATVASSIHVGHGPVHVIATAKHVIVNAVTEHTIVVLETDASGAVCSCRTSTLRPLSSVTSCVAAPWRGSGGLAIRSL